jgi:hypothetical protein
LLLEGIVADNGGNPVSLDPRCDTDDGDRALLSAPDPVHAGLATQQSVGIGAVSPHGLLTDPPLPFPD